MEGRHDSVRWRGDVPDANGLRSSEVTAVEARVTEDVLPGVGRRYEIEAGGSRLYVIAHRDGRREFWR